MSFMFNHCHKLKEIIGIDKFDISEVTNVYSVFGECSELI